MLEIKCSKCHLIMGDSWCQLKDAETWKTNTMCKAGLYQRVCDAALKLSKVYNINPEDKRIEGGKEQIEEMCEAYHKLPEDNTEELLKIYKEKSLKKFEELPKNEIEFKEPENEEDEKVFDTQMELI